MGRKSKKVPKGFELEKDTERDNALIFRTPKSSFRFNLPSEEMRDSLIEEIENPEKGFEFEKEGNKILIIKGSKSNFKFESISEKTRDSLIQGLKDLVNKSRIRTKQTE